MVEHFDFIGFIASELNRLSFVVRWQRVVNSRSGVIEPGDNNQFAARLGLPVFGIFIRCPTDLCIRQFHTQFAVGVFPRNVQLAVMINQIKFGILLAAFPIIRVEVFVNKVGDIFRFTRNKPFTHFTKYFVECVVILRGDNQTLETCEVFLPHFLRHVLASEVFVVILKLVIAATAFVFGIPVYVAVQLFVSSLFRFLFLNHQVCNLFCGLFQNKFVQLFVQTLLFDFSRGSTIRAVKVHHWNRVESLDCRRQHVRPILFVFHNKGNVVTQLINGTFTVERSERTDNTITSFYRAFLCVGVRLNVRNVASTENVRSFQCNLTFDIFCTVRHDRTGQQAQPFNRSRSGQSLNRTVTRRREVFQVVRFVNCHVGRRNTTDHFKVLRQTNLRRTNADFYGTASDESHGSDENGVWWCGQCRFHQTLFTPALERACGNRERVPVCAKEIFHFLTPRRHQTVRADNQRNNFGATDRRHILHHAGNVDNALTGFTAARSYRNNCEAWRIFFTQITLNIFLVREDSTNIFGFQTGNLDIVGAERFVGLNRLNLRFGFCENGFRVRCVFTEHQGERQNVTENLSIRLRVQLRNDMARTFLIWPRTEIKIYIRTFRVQPVLLRNAVNCVQHLLVNLATEIGEQLSKISSGRSRRTEIVRVIFQLFFNFNRSRNSVGGFQRIVGFFPDESALLAGCSIYGSKEQTVDNRLWFVGEPLDYRAVFIQESFVTGDCVVAFGRQFGVTEVTHCRCQKFRQLRNYFIRVSRTHVRPLQTNKNWRSGELCRFAQRAINHFCLCVSGHSVVRTVNGEHRLRKSTLNRTFAFLRHVVTEPIRNCQRISTNGADLVSGGDGASSVTRYGVQTKVPIVTESATGKTFDLNQQFFQPLQFLRINVWPECRRRRLDVGRNRHFVACDNIKEFIRNTFVLFGQFTFGQSFRIGPNAQSTVALNEHAVSITLGFFNRETVLRTQRRNLFQGRGAGGIARNVFNLDCSGVVKFVGDLRFFRTHYLRNVHAKPCVCTRQANGFRLGRLRNEMRNIRFQCIANCGAQSDVQQLSFNRDVLGIVNDFGNATVNGVSASGVIGGSFASVACQLFYFRARLFQNFDLQELFCERIRQNHIGNNVAATRQFNAGVFQPDCFDIGKFGVDWDATVNQSLANGNGAEQEKVDFFCGFDDSQTYRRLPATATTIVYEIVVFSAFAQLVLGVGVCVFFTKERCRQTVRWVFTVTHHHDIQTARITLGAQDGMEISFRTARSTNEVIYFTEDRFGFALAFKNLYEDFRNQTFALFLVVAGKGVRVEHAAPHKAEKHVYVRRYVGQRFQNRQHEITASAREKERFKFGVTRRLKRNGTQRFYKVGCRFRHRTFAVAVFAVIAFIIVIVIRSRESVIQILFHFLDLAAHGSSKRSFIPVCTIHSEASEKIPPCWIRTVHTELGLRWCSCAIRTSARQRATRTCGSRSSLRVAAV
ncbi:hypothetical protein D3C80_509710 [compost metagenome]